MERGGAKGGKAPPYPMHITIAGKTLSRTMEVKGKVIQAAGSKFELDGGKSPAWFDVTTATATVTRPAMKGLIKVEGDKLIWVYAMTGDRPAKIDAELGERQYRYTLKRVKK